MTHHSLAITAENENLTIEFTRLHLEFLDLFTRHKEMVEDESVILTSLYLEKLGHLQLELLEKQTEASRLKMKMNLVCSRLMDAGKLFFCWVVSKNWKNKWVQVKANIYMVE